MAIVKRNGAKKRVEVWGGVSGAATVLRAFELLGPGGGFVLSPVDNVRKDTERAWNNTRAFIETWKGSWA